MMSAIPDSVISSPDWKDPVLKDCLYLTHGPLFLDLALPSGLALLSLFWATRPLWQVNSYINSKVSVEHSFQPTSLILGLKMMF